MEKNRQESELTKNELRQLFQAVAQEIKRKPPVIGLVGVSGVGKGSPSKIAISMAVLLRSEKVP
jgi:hypothetical protein